jgi:hypothetical protein
MYDNIQFGWNGDVQPTNLLRGPYRSSRLWEDDEP